MDINDPSSYYEPSRTTAKEEEYRILLEEYYDQSPGAHVVKLQNFTKYVPVQDIRRFICRYELFKKILHIHGSIVECGVLHGGGLMTWAHLSEVFEPLNHTRKIIGFDSFEGIPAVTDKDSADHSYCARGSMALNNFEDVAQSAKLFDMNRFLSHIQKVELVKGDAALTVPNYVRDNPHLVISLLYLDFDVYEPTKIALRYLLPRISRGGIVAFDELNHELWPGETVAVMEEILLSESRIERFPFGTSMSYIVVGG